MNTFRTLGVVAVIPALLFLGGCSASATSQPAAGSAQQADGRAADYSAPDAPVPEGKPGDVTGIVQAKVARTASVGVTVADVEGAATKLRSIATAMGGLVTTENLVTTVDAEGISIPTSTMVISVPSDRLDSTLEQLKSVGTITSRVISSEDVSVQVADVDSRVKALEGSIARLNELSKKAGSVSELTQLEAELTSRIGERDSLVAQQRALAGRVAQSPITITLDTPPKVEEPELGPGFLGGLAAGWNALVSSSRVLLTIVGAVLPFLAVVGLVGTPIVLWRRRLHQRTVSPATVSPATDTSSAEDPKE